MTIKITKNIAGYEVVKPEEELAAHGISLDPAKKGELAALLYEIMLEEEKPLEKGRVAQLIKLAS